MTKKGNDLTARAMAGTQTAWNKVEKVTVTDLDGMDVEISVKAGMPLTDIFELVMEVAAGATSEGHYSDLFCDMILAQGIIDKLTDLPLPEDPKQMEIDQCYELVFGYEGIINRLHPDGGAMHLIRRIRRYTESVAMMMERNPNYLEEDPEQEIIGLEDLRNMGSGRA